MSKKITIQNIKNYLEGNFNKLKHEVGAQPHHIAEQIAYRVLKCQDCISKGRCMVCGCKAPGRLYTTESCNKDRFPDFMSEEDWKKFKYEQGITENLHGNS